ncbi:MAG TPA: hypothetical protein VEQ11_12200 [Chloroflexota bacterium]|nr:hypothetical protein [Chloroflexota bacterium]
MDSEARAAAWTFLGVLAGFKIAIALVIFWMDPSGFAAGFLFVTGWYCLLVPIAALALPGVYWFRLLRARAKRRDLIRSEWLVEPDLDWNPTTARGRM